MLGKVLSRAVLGVDAYPLPSISTVGLPDVAVKESREGVKPAVKSRTSIYRFDPLFIDIYRSPPGRPCHDKKAIFAA